MARVVAPNIPHHVTQRGNRKQDTFFRKKDYEVYVDLMAEWCGKWGVEVWAWCLMPNHIHLIAAPPSQETLARAIGEAHRRYTCMVNFRMGWKGHLWQGRFSSFPMDEAYVYRCARYIELNPVRAGLARRPENWPYSSARAHLRGRDDTLTRVQPLLEMVQDWREYLSEGEKGITELRRHERTGRPLGSEPFVAKLEKELGRVLRKRKPGPKARRKKKKR
jgi:putative transposase